MQRVIHQLRNDYYCLSRSESVAPLPKYVADFLTSGQNGWEFSPIQIQERLELTSYCLIQLKNRQLSPVVRNLKHLVIQYFD